MSPPAFELLVISRLSVASHQAIGPGAADDGSPPDRLRVPGYVVQKTRRRLQVGPPRGVWVSDAAAREPEGRPSVDRTPHAADGESTRRSVACSQR
jgi:hypothetical protein